MQLNVNENPYGPSRADSPTRSPRPSRRSRAGSTATPTARPWRCAVDLAAYLGHGLTADRVWAANGSNEVMLQVLQAFGGPGRTALSFAPTYSMYPEYARATSTRWVTGAAHRDLRIDLAAAAAAICRGGAECRLRGLAQQPDRAPVLARHGRSGLRGAAGAVVVVDEAYAEFRRDGPRRR